MLFGFTLAAHANDDHYDVSPNYIDDRSSFNQSGVKTPRDYFLPPTPVYENLDPTEDLDYIKTEYPPYAAILLPRALRIGNITLPAGYYQLKLSIVDAFSIAQQNSAKPKKRKDYPMVGSKPKDGPMPQFRFLLKQSGEVKASIPVIQSEETPKKIKGQPQGVLVIEAGAVLEQKPVSLKFCVQNICYRSAPILPGLIQ